MWSVSTFGDIDAMMLQFGDIEQGPDLQNIL